MLDVAEVSRLVSDLWPDWLDHRERSKEWQKWALGKQDLPDVPDSASAEFRELQRKAITPWLGLIVQSLTQALSVEGYRQDNAGEDNLLWAVWQANRMDGKQSAVYEAAFTTGISYVAVLPTDMPRARSKPMIRRDEGEMAVPEWRPYTSADMTAYWDSPNDEWPVYAIAAEPLPRWRQTRGALVDYRGVLFDATHVYLFETRNGTPFPVDDPRPHGFSTVPVVEFCNRRTITGRALGEVEPYIPVASRIDQDVFDRLTVQRFGSWAVRTATGLTMPESEDGKKQIEQMLKVSDILMATSPDAKFGSLPPTPLDGHLKAPIEDVRALAAVSQTPPTVLTADLSNISAEALAAVEAAFNRKVEQRKIVFGEAWEKVFALSGEIMGVPVDPMAQVRWRDMEARSLAQTADALGKLAQSLEIPVEVLWDKVPFLSDQDRERARQLRESDDAMGDLLRQLSDVQVPFGDALAADSEA